MSIPRVVTGLNRRVLNPLILGLAGHGPFVELSVLAEQPAPDVRRTSR